jgi:serine acetyltransferase
MIGPGAYVNFDVPAKALVLGNPGKVVSFPGSAGYINYTMVPAADAAPDPDALREAGLESPVNSAPGTVAL